MLMHHHPRKPPSFKLSVSRITWIQFFRCLSRRLLIILIPIEDPSTDIEFPVVLETQSLKGSLLRLVGVGVRTVSFLSIRVRATTLFRSVLFSQLICEDTLCLGLFSWILCPGRCIENCARAPTCSLEISKKKATILTESSYVTEHRGRTPPQART
jgi:hypothetical protein